jgi:hypothetical protein
VVIPRPRRTPKQRRRRTLFCGSRREFRPCFSGRSRVTPSAPGTTRSDAIRECLAIGIETIRERDGVPRGRVEELLGAIEGVRILLELLGPPTLGTQRLLAYWAARDRAVNVSEDELMAEVRTVGADEWEQAVADAERGLPETLPGGPHRGRS